MRFTIVFIAYLLTVMVLGALLSAPLYHLVMAVSVGPLADFADTPFRRVADRAFMIVALVGLYPLLRALHLDQGRRDLGYAIERRAFWRLLGIGVAFGVVSLGLLVLVEYALGILQRDLSRSAGTVVTALFEGLLAGLVIGFIEETFFRGAFYSACRRDRTAVFAIAVTSLLYASLHFIRSTGSWVEVHWYSGFSVLGGAFQKYSSPEIIGPFLALLAVGVLLAMMREHFGHIALNIGIHCGWVAVIKTAKKATNLNHESPLAWLAIGYDTVTGWLAFVYILLLIGGCLLWHRRRAAAAAVAGAPR